MVGSLSHRSRYIENLLYRLKDVCNSSIETILDVIVENALLVGDCESLDHIVRFKTCQLILIEPLTKVLD